MVISDDFPTVVGGRIRFRASFKAALVALALALTICLDPCPVVQAAATPAAVVDVRAEVAAALYAASATQAAAERLSNQTLRAQRQRISDLEKQVRDGDARSKAAEAALTTAREDFVAGLAAQDRAYAEEIAVLRGAVEDIASTPEGAAALARFNAGDEVGALAVLDGLRAARDQARQKRADIESAAEGRRIATLALEARGRGKMTSAEVLARFEEVVRLDPGVAWDSIELGRLYVIVGRLSDANRAFRQAIKTASDERYRAVASIDLGDNLVAQGNLVEALGSYQYGHVITEALAARDPTDMVWRHNLSVANIKFGDLLMVQGQYAQACWCRPKTDHLRGCLPIEN